MKKLGDYCMRIIDADELIDLIQHSNLEFIPSKSIIKCLVELIDNQTTVNIELIE